MVEWFCYTLFRLKRQFPRSWWSHKVRIFCTALLYWSQLLVCHQGRLDSILVFEFPFGHCICKDWYFVHFAPSERFFHRTKRGANEKRKAGCTRQREGQKIRFTHWAGRKGRRGSHGGNILDYCIIWMMYSINTYWSTTIYWALVQAQNKAASIIALGPNLHET